jgi:hypothetical protein
MKRILFFDVVFFLLFQFVSFSQNVGINSDGSIPDRSAMLDIKSSNKGLLIPQITLTGIYDITTIPSPAISLLIYNTTNGFGLTPGYYYWTGTYWAHLSIGSSHYVGELYGGGVVFYVDQTGDHGLICSMIDLSFSQIWSNNIKILIGQTAQSDWNG